MSDLKVKVQRKPLKTHGTLYTPEMISAAQNNASRYEWAKAEVTEITEKADKILKIGYARAVDLMPSPDIWRSHFLNDHIGCPVCGEKNFAAGNVYLWDYSDPWKLVCPTCKSIFPANDFESYYKSGMDAYGDFHREKADAALLVNTRYPEKEKDYCVDDGRGMFNDRKENYAAIGHCAHKLWWRAYTNLTTLRLAYLYTGNQEYADFAIVMLSRIADIYPEINLDYEAVNATFVSVNGGSATEGKIMGRIFETLFATEYAYAYDAVFTAFPTVSQKALSFIKEHSPFSSDEYTDVMVKIEDRLIKEIYPNVACRNIGGNMGMHQASLAAAAKCIDSPDFSPEWLDFVFRAGDGYITGGNVNNIMLEVVDRDGFGNEASPAYNKGWLKHFMNIADILDGYCINGTDLSYDLYKNPKMKKMFLGFSELILSDKYNPHIGDTCDTGTAYRHDDVVSLARAFTVYGDPIFAKALFKAANGDLSGINTGMFTENPEQIQKDVKDIIEKDGELDIPSYILNGYGFSVLKNRSKNYDKNYPVDTTAAVFFGKNFGHGHRDALNLYLYSHHVDIAPDHGNPDYKNATNPHRYQVVNTTLAHNSVVVDGFSQNNNIVVGSTRHFAGGDQVQLIDVSSDAYSQCSLYARTVATVKISDTQTYILDFFRVKGGSEHKYSFHTMPATDIQTTGLRLEKQVDEKGEYVGTYAGRDIEFGTVEFKDETLYKSRGYQWYTNVNKDTSPEEKITLDLRITDHHKLAENLQGDLKLNVTMLGKHDEIALVNGVPPRLHVRNPRTLSYLFATNKGENSESVFVTAFEPYDSADGSQIADISPLSVTMDGKEIDSYLVKAVKVTLKNGRVDYIVCSYDQASTYRIGEKFDFCGFFGFYSEENGKVHIWMHDAAKLGSAATTDALRGKIVDFQKELSCENFIKVRFEQSNIDPNMLRGLYIKAEENERSINPVYKIVSARENDDGSFTLDIGDISLIRKHSASEASSSPYEYNLSHDQAFSIPLTFVFSY